ncbi:MAG: ABC transporter ATP-binding protein YtrB [Bacteroidetes bacterium ADurb.Bin234]|jgi:ABC-2 type transport system ATP-binding protein|nr:MAG: ABC transporter ATP-binding protein YtrB [Bacteroidetes bacterium ADurb.Bin234]
MIEIKSIDFAYSKKQKLFQDLNLSMQSGHIYGLLGKNGAGKTSLLKILSGLRFPQKGSVEVLAYRAEFRKPEMLREIYFLPEEIFTPMLKIRQLTNVYASFYPNFSLEQYNAYLEEFDITNRDLYINKLSHGQKKKVLIAFALACNTKILLMDEPTNGLDIPSKSIFRKVMASAATEDRLVLISTHQVRDLHSLIDSIIILDNGEIVVNEPDERITQKLCFQAVDGDVDEKEVLYFEENLRGNLIVTENKHQIDSHLDLELFFNAVMANKKRIKEIFNA